MNLAMNPMQPNPRSNLPIAPLNTLLGFELETYQVPLDQLLPSKKVPDGVMSTRK